MGEVRICTYNVHQWMNAGGFALNYNDVCQNISTMNADIVCLQEVYHENDPNKAIPWKGNNILLIFSIVDIRDQYKINGEQILDIVAKKLNMEYVFGDGYWCFGNAILSR